MEKVFNYTSITYIRIHCIRTEDYNIPSNIILLDRRYPRGYIFPSAILCISFSFLLIYGGLTVAVLGLGSWIESLGFSSCGFGPVVRGHLRFLGSGLFIWTYNNNPGKETLHPRRYLMVALWWSISYNRCLVIARTNKILYWFFPNEFIHTLSNS